MDQNRNRSITEMTPEEIEREIDEFESELSRCGAEYETLLPSSEMPWYRRIWQRFSKAKPQEN